MTERVMKNNALLSSARALRREQTPQESKLWYDYLRKYPRKVYRQRIIESLIVDFYCASARLVIELDGAPHFTKDGRIYDYARTQRLELYGLKVIRFTDAQVDCHFEDVCR